MLHYVRVLVKRSPMDQMMREVPSWELPLLETVFPGNVEPQGELYVDRPAPEARDEYERLSAFYKQTEEDDGRKGPLFVAAVYGQYNVGVAKLGRAIKDATVKAAPEGAEIKTPVKKRVKIGDLFQT